MSEPVNADTHVLYRFYSATGQLLYVGITMNPPRRFKGHSGDKEWWHLVSGITVETYSSRGELEAAERRAIQVERPKYNVIHNGERKLHRDRGASPTGATRALMHICRKCKNPVADGKGWIRVDKSKVHETISRWREWKRDIDQRYQHEGESILTEHLVEDAERVGGVPRGVPGLMVIKGSDLPDIGPVRWETYHFDCDPDIDDNLYGVDVARCRTQGHLLSWTAHLMGKRWIRDTNWDAFIRAHLTRGEMSA